MGRVEFKTENKAPSTNYDYPKLKLGKDERARIVLLEDPVMEYVHTLRAPQIVGGKPVMEKITRRDNTEFEQYKMDFVSRPICEGDETILGEKGSDPKNCPMCALAAENSEYTSAPQRRFAMHVIRYKTKPGESQKPVEPFNVEVLVWSFTDKVFGKIVDFKEEWGDLRTHDLLLGPCTNPAFQQFDISVAAKAAWLEDEQRKLYTAQTFKNNQIPDLSIACGTKKKREWIDGDIAKIREKWAEALGADSADNTANVDDVLGNNGSLIDGIDDLTKSVEPKQEGSMADLLGSDGVDSEGWAKSEGGETSALLDGLNLDASTPEPEAPAQSAPAAEEKKPEAKPVPKTDDDFSDLLGDILA